MKTTTSFHTNYHKTLMEGTTIFLPRDLWRRLVKPYQTTKKSSNQDRSPTTKHQSRYSWTYRTSEQTNQVEEKSLCDKTVPKNMIVPTRPETTKKKCEKTKKNEFVKCLREFVMIHCRTFPLSHSCHNSTTPQYHNTISIINQETFQSREMEKEPPLITIWSLVRKWRHCWDSRWTQWWWW